MKTIPIDVLKNLRQKIYSDTIRPYSDKNSLVRWLYWSRLNTMLKVGQSIGGEKILDLGCGGGVFLPALSENFYDVYAIDLDISFAKKVIFYYKLDNVYPFQCDFINNSFKDNFFDIIFAASVLEHFEDQDRLFYEIRRILAPNKYLIFLSPTETRFYVLGRKIFGYKKPDDHYFSAAEVADAGTKFLKLISKRYGPIPILSIIAQYCLYVLNNKY